MTCWSLEKLRGICLQRLRWILAALSFPRKALARIFKIDAFLESTLHVRRELVEPHNDRQTKEMAGILDLTPGGGLRTVGMRERDFRYPSLHGKSSRPSEQPRKPSPPINAPPRGSSSDEESDEQTIPYGEASDDSEFGGSGRKKNSNGNAKLATGTGSSLAEPEEDDKKNELSVEPSNIRAVTFTSGRGPGSRNGSQSSQKRKDADVEDDEMPMSFSQHQKKPKHGYGHNNVNIHKGSVTKPNNPKKAPLKETEKAGPAFKKPNTDAMLAQCRISSGLLIALNVADLD